jgi:hypothetical protein
MPPWEQFSWGIFWAVLAALAAWEILKWVAIGLLALVSHVIDNW